MNGLEDSGLSTVYGIDDILQVLLPPVVFMVNLVGGKKSELLLLSEKCYCTLHPPRLPCIAVYVRIGCPNWPKATYC